MINRSIFTGERASLRDIEGVNMARYRFALKYCRGKKVLELGCGVGYGVHYLAAKGAASVVAYDASRETIEFAKKEFNYKNLRYRCGKVEEIRAKDKYDVVIAFELIEHLVNPDVLLGLARSSLKKGGVFLVSTPNRLLSSYDGDKPSNPYHVREYSPEEFKRLLERFFTKIDIYGIVLKKQKKIKESSVKQTWRWKLASYLVRKRWIRRMVNYLPKTPKRLFSGEVSLKFSTEDFKLAKKEVGSANYLFTVCVL